MDSVAIIDENGELAEAVLRQFGRSLVAVCEGRFILPGNYTVLSMESSHTIKAAERRAQ